MITLQDCIAIAEHDRIPEIAAAALAQYLLSREHGTAPRRSGTCCGMTFVPRLAGMIAPTDARSLWR